MEKSLKDYLLKEGIFDPVREELCPQVWDKEKKLKKSVKSYIVNRLNTWLSTYTSEKPKELYLIGSTAGLQYTKTSDIDINVVINLSKEKIDKIGEFLPNERPLPGTEHPVNYYLTTQEEKEDKMADWKKDPMYDIVKDRWVTEPKKTETKSIVKNFRAVTEIARFFIAGIEAAISEYQMDVNTYNTYKAYLKDDITEGEEKDLKELMKLKLQEIVADTDGIYIAKHMIKSLRKEAYEKDFKELEIYTKISVKSANTEINNLIYKYVEKLGYFDKIAKIMDSAEDWKKEIEKY
jgi:hypothetical protein